MEEQTRPGMRSSAPELNPLPSACKRTIGGFDTDAEAVAFVLKVLAVDQTARTDAARVSDIRWASCRGVANEAQQAFWGTVERAAGLATGKPGSNEAITTVINMGLM
jgi:hypothetical protein